MRAQPELRGVSPSTDGDIMILVVGWLYWQLLCLVHDCNDCNEFQDPPEGET